jgi:hypothetical protein
MRPQARRPDPDREEADVHHSEQEADPEHQAVVLIPRFPGLILAVGPRFKPFPRLRVPSGWIPLRNA